MGNFQQMILPWLLVLVFIIHDGEEVLFLPRWVKANVPLLDGVEERFPVIRKSLHLLRENNQRQFTFSVFVLLCVISILTSLLVFQPGNFAFQFIYIGITAVFTLHLIVHILQSIIIKRIVPGTTTSAFVFLPSLLLLHNQISFAHLTFTQSLLVVLVGLAIFLPIFTTALRLGQWIGKPKSLGSES